MSLVSALLGCSAPATGLAERDPAPSVEETGSQDTAVDSESDTADSASESGDSGIETDEPDGATWYRIDRSVALDALPSLGAVLNEGSQQVRTGFGPRVLGSRDDFHLGLDIEAPRHTPILAVSEGEVYRVHPSEKASDPNTLYIAHDLDEPVSFHGQSIDRMFVVYSHLEDFSVNEGDRVVAGQQVGTVGDSGGAEDTHVHVEVRLGTHCSLRYSTKNPDSNCARDYDPAVNPLHVIPGRDAQIPTVSVVTMDPFVLRVATRMTDQDINRLASSEGVLDLDQRTSIAAETLTGLDDFDYGWAVLRPAKDDGAHRVWEVEFDVPPTWVELTDVHGEGWRLEL